MCPEHNRRNSHYHIAREKKQCDNGGSKWAVILACGYYYNFRDYHTCSHHAHILITSATATFSFYL